MHQALYRKWRPSSFDDVSGQDHITSVLKYEVDNAKFSHAYLFCGSRGTGKTTCAKILAKAVNCESPINGNPCNKCASCLAVDNGATTDVLEMDAASNNGVDNIRDIRDEVIYTPSLLKYRVYIVDEVHMLTGSAFNALLKTLEEPPSHVIFILATTELHKLPSTIISRCQRFDFRRITVPDIMSRLLHIAQKEGITVDNDALRLIAKYSQGGMRDAISLFELCSGNRSSLGIDDVTETIGSLSNERITELLCAVHDKNYDVIFSIVNDIVNSSKDLTVFFDDLIAFCRNMLVFKTVSQPEVYLDLTESEKQQLSTATALFTKDTLLYFIRILNDSLFLMQKSTYTKRYVAEMALIKMGDDNLDTSADALASRISRIETAVSTASVLSAAPIQTVTKKEPVAKQPKKVETQPQVPQQAPAVNKAPFSGKLIRGWADMVESISTDKQGAKSFLKMAKAYQSPDGKISVKFNNDFDKKFFVDSGLSPLLYIKLSELLKRSISENDVEYAIADSTTQDNDELDDII